jgi:hypothetical protein
MKMLVTDYDGTLAQSDSYVSKKSKQALELLGKKNVVRVIATGRSIFSIRQVISIDFPVDYIVFSSGVGVLNWKTGEVLTENHLMPSNVDYIEAYLEQHAYDFMIQYPLPDNHMFYVHVTSTDNKDFHKRIEVYRNYGLELPVARPLSATQFIVICKDNIGQYDQIKAFFSEFKVVRATSPLDHKSIWIEIFPKQVSKAAGIQFLCEALGIKNAETIVCGNDYNDLDMLEWSKNPFVVENAVSELITKYPVITSNNKDGVAELIASIF